MIFVEAEESTLEKEYIDKIKKECFSKNININHAKADNILCDFLESLGYTEIVKVYASVYKDFYQMRR